MFDSDAFAKQLQEAALNEARGQAAQSSYDVNCPKCHQSFNAHSGENICPHCGKTINITFDIKF